MQTPYTRPIMSPCNFPDPSHILVVRLSAIGDILMASGLPSLLKQRWPACEITWLCQPECASLLQHSPDVDHILTWARRDWQQAWQKKQLGKLGQQMRAFRKDCLERQFDLAVDLQGLFKSALLTRLSGAPRRVGLGTGEGAGFFYTQRFGRNLGNPALIGSEYRYLAEQLGLDSGNYRMQVHTEARNQQEAQDLTAKSGATEQGYFVFCPFTTRPQKHWFEAHWKELGDLFETRLQLPVLVLGGPADQKAAQQLCDGTPMHNLAGETNLLDAYELIRGSRGVIGVDTGLTHMGHAARVPTLSLFGSTCPYRNPDNPNGRVLYLDLHCAPCKRNPTCDGRFDCMQQITPQMAMDNFLPLLERAL